MQQEWTRQWECESWICCSWKNTGGAGGRLHKRLRRGHMASENRQHGRHQDMEKLGGEDLLLMENLDCAPFLLVFRQTSFLWPLKLKERHRKEDLSDNKGRNLCCTFPCRSNQKMSASSTPFSMLLICPPQYFEDVLLEFLPPGCLWG